MKGSSEVLTGDFREGVREACNEFIGFQKTIKLESILGREWIQVKVYLKYRYSMM